MEIKFLDSDEKYIKYDVSDIKTPILRFEDWYTDTGIINVVQMLVKQIGIGEKDVVCLPQQVLVNPKTGDQLEACIRETWEWYNVNKHDGTWKRGGPKKYKTKHPLTEFDKNVLSIHFLNLTPQTDEQVPEGQCWIKKELKIAKGVRE